MSEKVKLPKSVCDALDEIQIDIKDKARIFHDISNGFYSIKYPAFYEKGLKGLITNKILMFKIMQALVLGYEPESTKYFYREEQEIKALWDQQEKICDYANGIREGIKQTLSIIGIKYDWLDNQ